MNEGNLTPLLVVSKYQSREKREEERNLNLFMDFLCFDNVFFSSFFFLFGWSDVIKQVRDRLPVRPYAVLTSAPLPFVCPKQHFKKT